LGTATGLITTEQSVRAANDQIIVDYTLNLNSTVGAHSTSIQTQATTINGLSGQYTVKIDNNGYVSGFGLASTTVNGTPTSEFIVNADKFAVVMPGYSSAHPFTIGAVGGVPRVMISSALIGDASITTAKIGTAQVNTLSIAGAAITAPAFVSAAMADVSLYYTLTGISGEYYSVFILCTLVQSYYGGMYLSINGVNQWGEIPISGTLATKGTVVSLTPGTYTIRFRSDNAGNSNGTSIYVLATKR
jgi:hypothetical protein